MLAHKLFEQVAQPRLQVDAPPRVDGVEGRRAVERVAERAELLLDVGAACAIRSVRCARKWTAKAAERHVDA